MIQSKREVIRVKEEGSEEEKRNQRKRREIRVREEESAKGGRNQSERRKHLER